MAEAKKTEEGTGKHPHKITEEPYPHMERSEREKGKASAEAGEEKRVSSQGAGADDLKSREYRDKDGNIHHHTRTYMEQHKAKGS